MNRFRKTVLSLAVAATTMAPLSIAQADDFLRRPGHRPAPVHQAHDRDGMIAAGLVGLAIGAIIVGATTRPQADAPYDRNPYRHPRPSADRDYFPQAPGYIPADFDDDDYGEGYEDEIIGTSPWTPEWYQYCVDRYRSFDPRTGTYTTYGGEQRFCVAN